MVVVVKKYFFLLLLFIIYIVLITKEETKDVSVNISDKNNISDYKIMFVNGINSNKLQEIFYLYKKDYLIFKINKYDVSCDDINICINQIYKEQTLDFEIERIVNGFKINVIELVVSKEDIQDIFNKKDLTYKIY